MVYEWRTDIPRQIRASAQKAGEICEELERSGGLTPERLVDVSRAEDAPLHGEFEWNDDVAAEKYRVEQARSLIRCLIVRQDPAEEERRTVTVKPPARAFFNLTRGQGYESVARIVQSKDKMARLLGNAFRDLRSFRQKYDALQELNQVMGAIDDTLDRRARDGRQDHIQDQPRPSA